MPYIGTQPLTGQFKKLDAITVVNGQAAYTLNHNSAAYKPATANALLVSVNGVIQAAGDAFTISGSTITFTENLVTGDVIDFIIALGDTGSAVTPVDGSVTTAKLGDDSVTKAKIGTTELDLATIKDSSGTNTAITIDSSGRVLTPVRPAFHVYMIKASGASNSQVSGVLAWNGSLFNEGSHFEINNSRFKAPVHGLYQFNFVGFESGASANVQTASATQVALETSTDGTNYTVQVQMHDYAEGNSHGNCSFSQALMLNANEYARINVVDPGLYLSGDREYLNFSGYLVG